MPALEKRSLVLAGHRTSLALEPEFWAALDAAAAARGAALARLIEEIDAGREAPRSLASACRVFALAAR
ncbi:MAG: ribbon-helix-helix domain-containing protein [Hyphomonadaceae bacterium]